MAEDREDSEEENQMRGNYFRTVYEMLRTNNGRWLCPHCGRPCEEKPDAKVVSGKFVSKTVFECKIHGYRHHIDDEVLFAVKRRIIEEDENHGS
jgi:hypothetical protein